jgi:hypothetical protein
VDVHLVAVFEIVAVGVPLPGPCAALIFLKVGQAVAVRIVCRAAIAQTVNVAAIVFNTLCFMKFPLQSEIMAPPDAGGMA